MSVHTYWDVFKHNVRQLLIAVDQFANVFICMLIIPWERSWADETFSARCYRWDVGGVRHWPRIIVDRIALWLNDPDHCAESFRSERQGRQLPPEARL